MKHFFTTLSLLGVLLFSQSHGAVIYTDVNPDATITNSNYLIDIDNNGKSDFSFSAVGTSSLGWVRCDSGTDTLNSVLIDSQGSSYVSALSSGISIGATSGYWHQLNTATSPIMYVIGLGGSGGGFTGAQDYFVGLKFHIGTDYHYGWARLRVNTSNMSFTLKDYAYESVANTPIIAGLSIGVNNLTKQESPIRICVEHQQIKLSTLFPQSAEVIHATLYDISGRLVQDFGIIDMASGKAVLNIQGVIPGVYILHVDNNGHIKNTKLLISQ